MAATAELTRLDQAIDRGTRRLLELQRPDGIWVGELESNVTMTAQHLFWHHYLDLRTPELDRRIANELLARRRDDGTWSIWFEGPPDLSTSIEAYVACRLAGVDPGPKALAYIQRAGGIPKSRLFTKCFMALLGQWPWQRMAPIPPELVLLRPGSPFSIYDFSCGARRTVPGAGSSRRGCGGSSPSPRSATGSTTRCLARRSRAGRDSWSTTASGSGPRRASRRSGTPGSPCWRCVPAVCPKTTRSSSAPASTSSHRRCTPRATGRFAGRTSRPAAGPSSTKTSTTPTSTTRLSCRSPFMAWASARRTRSRAVSTGSSECSRGTEAGGRSTWTTMRGGC